MMPAADDPRHRLGGVLDGRERREDGLHPFRQVREAHDHAGHQAQRALGAHHHPGEVVARPLVGLAAEPDELAGAGDHLEPEHVVHGDAVLQAVRSARIGRRVAADGGHHLAGRIRGEEVAALPRGLAQPQVDEPGLHGGAAVRRNPAPRSAFMRVMDTMTPPSGAIAPPIETGARAARHDRHVLAPAEADDGRHLRRRLRQHHRVGSALVERVHVALVGEPALHRDDERGGADDVLERRRVWGVRAMGGVSG